MQLSWFIANRLGKAKGNAKANGKKAKGLGARGNVIAKISVAVSVAIIIVAGAVSSGFRTQLRDSAAGFCGDATISLPGLSSASEPDLAVYAIEPLRFIDKIKSLSYVSDVKAVSYRPGLLKTADQIEGIIMKGVDSSYNCNPQNSDEVFISQRMANSLSLDVGEKVNFYFVGGDVRIKRFKIAGVYSSHLEEFDKLYVIAKREVVDELNGWGKGELSNYEIYYNDHSERQMKRRKDEIQNLLFDNVKEGEQMLLVSSLEDNSHKLMDWLNLLDTNVLIILCLMVAVAGFNMISCILIILFENISTIGVLKTLGMQNGGIKRVFLAKSCKTVLYGLVYGTLASLLFCIMQQEYHLIGLNPENYFLSYVPVNLSVMNVLLTDAVCFAVIMAALLIPCHFINKIDPTYLATLRL